MITVHHYKTQNSIEINQLLPLPPPLQASHFRPSHTFAHPLPSSPTCIPPLLSSFTNVIFSPIWLHSDSLRDDRRRDLHHVHLLYLIQGRVDDLATCHLVVQTVAHTILNTENTLYIKSYNNIIN